MRHAKMFVSVAVNRRMLSWVRMALGQETCPIPIIC